MEYGDIYIDASVLITLIICAGAVFIYMIQTIAPVRKTNASTRFWKIVLPSIKEIIIGIFRKRGED